ncbi:hypothetical protein PIB30_048290 [Stylosanthes scabra]|uniref:Uncharacterized protein n=1 Tax=Stylosanthes scabra TaxID=79078 RepID=A0ABU6UFQ0_9FABA|nr:hypothetical protein [Stylosanthes scabra]
MLRQYWYCHMRNVHSWLQPCSCSPESALSPLGFLVWSFYSSDYRFLAILGVKKSMRKAKEISQRRKNVKWRNEAIVIGLEQTWTLWKYELNFYNFHVEDFFQF